jgi:hypothetical protein
LGSISIGQNNFDMSALSMLQNHYPEAEGYWREMSMLFTQTPTTVCHVAFTVKPVAQVADGAMVIYPMPHEVPEQVPSADEIFQMALLWCKVEGQQTNSAGEIDLMVQIIAGRESAPDTDPLPETPCLTFKKVRNLLIPSKLLDSAHKTQVGKPKAAARVGKKAARGAAPAALAAGAAPAAPAEPAAPVNARCCSRVFVLHGKFLFLC